VLLPQAIAQGVRDQTVTQAFRTWEEPRVKVGGTQLTSAGVIAFDACEEIADTSVLTEEDARTSGVADLAELLRRLTPGQVRRGPRGGRGGDRIFRIRLRYVGEDPRLALRERPDRARMVELRRAIAALDAGRHSGPWTFVILDWIDTHPGIVATELAAVLGRELAPVKADVRKLKALGLTISLRVGYRLSESGVAYLRAERRRRKG